jgi:predicted metal-dependent hydrolase
LPRIDFGEHHVDYTVVKGRSSRHTYFRFRSDRTLEITIPKGGRVDVESAIGEKRSWILRNYLEMLGNQRVLDGSSLLYDGRRLRIKFEGRRGPDEVSPEFDDGRVVIRTTEKSLTRELVKRWFLRETSRYVVRRTAELARELGLKYRVVDVRDIRSWGYCTRDGRLSFSWQLMALSARLRDYVIVHELSHLVEFNHSARFKRRMASVCPDYRQREAELRRITTV